MKVESRNSFNHVSYLVMLVKKNCFLAADDRGVVVTGRDVALAGRGVVLLIKTMVQLGHIRNFSPVLSSSNISSNFNTVIVCHVNVNWLTNKVILF